MVTPLEVQFASNVVSIFGGNEILVGLVAGTFFIALVALTRIPMQIAAPVYTVALLILAILIPPFQIIFAIVAGLIIAGFIYSIWGK